MKCDNCRIPVVAIPERKPIQVKICSRAGPIKAEGTPPVIKLVSGEEYKGSYEITPGEQTQVLETAGLVASGNIVINPIPSSYGKISWDGCKLTIS